MTVQFRLLQDSPLIGRSPWSIEQFYIFHIHSSLKWILFKDPLNSTFLTITKKSNNQIIYETKDVSFNSNSILQIEYNDTINLEYSIDFGSTWFDISDDNQLKYFPIKFSYENITFYRLTITLNIISIVRFRLQIKENHLQYISIGRKCFMNCYGHARCINGECQLINSFIPLVC